MNFSWLVKQQLQFCGFYLFFVIVLPLLWLWEVCYDVCGLCVIAVMLLASLSLLWGLLWWLWPVCHCYEVCCDVCGLCVTAVMLLVSLSLLWGLLWRLWLVCHCYEVCCDVCSLCVTAMRSVVNCSQVEEVKKMKIGDPLDTDTNHGPQNHRYFPTSNQLCPFMGAL